ncbi:DUF58 domain-containing protein [Homoserinimonas sp. OAct 916]|uniref:DUF58 domain-containing protein n=1 Tax=Homoserinimonas sp. OAct 916 TaxID=2211450 RepID=UPI001E3C1935|nr:DUF58 domain-containing protein [Homoserinimonas sp. OAct 916]
MTRTSGGAVRPETDSRPRSGIRGRRALTRGEATSQATRGDSLYLSGAGFTNARSKIVGDREGLLADMIVWIVRNVRRARTSLVAVAVQLGSVVTVLGWCIAGTVFAGLVFGYRLGWVEMVAISWACLLIAACAAAWIIGRQRQVVHLEMPVNRVTAGEKASGWIIALNPTGRRLLSMSVEVPVADGLIIFNVPSLAAGARFDDRFFVPTTRRGVIEVGPVRTVRQDPIGLVRREYIWEKTVELFVHPKTISIPSTSTGFFRDLEGNPSRELTSSDVAFHALREYVPGDERRYIHWKSTAKTGVHMVREFEQTKRSHLMVALSLASADYASDAEFELAVSVAGSLGVRAIRDARTVSVVASESTPEFAKRRLLAVKKLDTLSRPRLLDDLCRLELSPTALSVIDLARVSADDVSGISVVFLVCGSTVTPTQLRAASVTFPVGVSVVAVVCDIESAPRLRRITELTVLTIGYLDDLKKSLARSAST